MSRGGRRARRPAAVLAVLVALASPGWAAEGWLVERLVEADAFQGPVAMGVERACPERLAPPVDGARVRLLASGGDARRDEPGLSFIVRLDAGRALLLHHRQSTYSEFPLPLDARALDTGWRANLGEDADEFLSFRLEGEVREEGGRIGELATLVRAATVGNQLGRRLDVTVHFLADGEAAEAAEAARAVEGFSQAVWRAGEEWLALIGQAAGIPLTLRQAAHQPETKIEYVELFESLERLEVDPSRFAPPDDYARIDHRPQCFSSR